MDLRLLFVLVASAALAPRLSVVSAAAPPRLSYTVTGVDLKRGLLDIDWTFSGAAARLCVDMTGGEIAVADLRQVLPRGEVPLRRDGDCFRVAAPAATPLRLRYRFDLGLLSERRGDPDYAARSGDSFIFNDQALVLRPEPAPPDQTPIDATFRLPRGSLVSHWAPLPPAAPDELRFRYDFAQYGAGTYLVLGPHRPLGSLTLKGGTALLTLLRGDGAPLADDAALRAWVQQSLSAVADFYGELPGRRAHVILAPVAESSEAGVFGSILRRGQPSAVLYFGAKAPGPEFLGHWMGYHELFHMGNPATERRLPWFVEGFTTYYQDVLRGRDGSRSDIDLWADLYDGFRRYCDPQDGRSLRDESINLRRLHHYQRLYWGGACLAFRVDVAIRHGSGGQRSLDDVMRALRRRGQQESLSEDEVIAALEQAIGPPSRARPFPAGLGPGMIRAHLDTRAPIALAALYRDLGIEPTGPDTVRLRDDAPFAALRRQIFRNPSAGPASP